MKGTDANQHWPYIASHGDQEETQPRIQLGYPSSTDPTLRATVTKKKRSLEFS
jgi:hypothetical protein